MNELDNAILTAVKEVDPNAPAVRIADATIATTLAPANPATILADLELAISLVKEFKAKIKGLHPTVINIIKLLF